MSVLEAKAMIMAEIKACEGNMAKITKDIEKDQQSRVTGVSQ